MNGKSDKGDMARTTRIMIGILIFLAIAGMFFLHLSRGSAHNAGLIELSDFQLQLDSDGLDLQVTAEVNLSPTVQAGLNSGVPLTFIIDIEIKKPHSWRPDKTVLEFQRRYTLTYYDLTRHYRVTAVEADDSRNFRSLSSALAGMGEMVRIRAVLDSEQRLLFEQQGLQARLNMQLSRSALPLPLQPVFRSSWTLVSEDYRWPIT